LSEGGFHEFLSGPGAMAGLRVIDLTRFSAALIARKSSPIMART